jgi:AcrR family transcriptional regulator
MMSTGLAPRRPTREAILEAAVALFLERGIKAEDVTVAEIATRAGVARRSVYVHFGSRTGLLVAMVQHVDAEGVLEQLIQRVGDALTSPDALDAVAVLHAEYSPVAYPIARVLMAGRYRDDALGAAWDDRMAARRSLYASVVQRLERDGLLSSDWDVHAATDFVWALTSWQMWEQLVVEQGWSKERYRHVLEDVLRRTLIAVPG